MIFFPKEMAFSRSLMQKMNSHDFLTLILSIRGMERGLEGLELPLLFEKNSAFRPQGGGGQAKGAI